MNFPVKVFEINGANGEFIKLEITEVYGFPNETSFRGGYDVKCNLEIASGYIALKPTFITLLRARFVNFITS